MFVSPYVCNRRIYNKKGKWKNPNNDVEEVIFYFVKVKAIFQLSFLNSLASLCKNQLETVCMVF